jgi:hypothetical protein
MELDDFAQIPGLLTARGRDREVEVAAEIQTAPETQWAGDLCEGTTGGVLAQGHEVIPHAEIELWE